MPGMKLFILNHILFLNDFYKQQPLINTLFGHGSFSAALGVVGASAGGSQMRSTFLSLQPFTICLLLALPASSLTAQKLPSSQTFWTCSSPYMLLHIQGQGHISSFLLERSFKHRHREPPPFSWQFRLTFQAWRRWCLFWEALPHLMALSFLLLCSHGFVTLSHCILKSFSFIIKGTQTYSRKFGQDQKKKKKRNKLKGEKKLRQKSTTWGYKYC